MTWGEALTSRAARAVVGTRSRHPDKRARPLSGQTQDPNGEGTTLRPCNSLYPRDKQSITETPLPKAISYKPTHDRETTLKTQKRPTARNLFTR
ncbi:hypothetical protein NDU88_000661 [Pleurodeles waltl]|uniref:Uncharacterized protein n=1 Tax=Pleurodeles waltl TaxID=8319 RepID=A0AAV7ML64_PLEWA|nr:hypothetical protein NDU88_000661 [Pleurodeles waltl]